MNREIKSIVIDRVIAIKDDEEILITDPSTIKSEVNKHFQKIAGSINQDKNITGKWIE